MTTHRNTSEGGGFPAWGNVWFTGRCIQIIVRCSRHNDETKIQQEKPQQISSSLPVVKLKVLLLINLLRIMPKLGLICLIHKVGKIPIN